MRLRDFSDSIPKPMVPIGYRPIIWHVMKYYAHFGHKEFILCLGYKADVIKRYFLEYNECVSNDFVLHGSDRGLELLSRDIADWKITFVDTGLTSNIGQRLLAVKNYVVDENCFLANYVDGLCDLDLNRQIDFFKKSGKTACFTSVIPTSTFHVVQHDEKGIVHGIEHIRNSKMRVNGGYFCFKKDIFDNIKNGEDLVEEPFHRLIAEQELMTFNHDGFWACMDTFKEKEELEDLFTRSVAPWEVWNARGDRSDV
jgi:glucose-1-phosphate cytidylyltransferase